MRLLVWNIQFFTLYRIADDRHIVNKKTGKTVREPMISAMQSMLNLNLIVDTVRRANADIFVVIEVLSGQGAIGGLISGNGSQAVLYLLEQLRKQQNDWCLVPLLRTVNQDHLASKTYTEGVGVFYRSANLDFIGPYVWPNAAPPPGVEKVAVPAGVAAGAYPPPWNNCLPANNFYAGQARFFADVARTRELTFPKPYHRRPFLTRFNERAGQQRTITLLSVHTAPNNKLANQGTATMTHIREIGGDGDGKTANAGPPIAANEVVLVAGDFNINLLGSSTKQGGYDLFKFAGYLRHFSPAHSSTTIRDVSRATPYVGASDYYSKPEALDNVLSKYGTTANGNRPAANGNPLVIDRVAGVTGFPSDMLRSLNYIVHTAKPISLFREIANYGHIGNYPGVSDHLPIMLDV